MRTHRWMILLCVVIAFGITASLLWREGAASTIQEDPKGALGTPDVPPNLPSTRIAIQQGTEMAPPDPLTDGAESRRVLRVVDDSGVPIASLSIGVAEEKTDPVWLGETDADGVWSMDAHDLRGTDWLTVRASERYVVRAQVSQLPTNDVKLVLPHARRTTIVVHRLPADSCCEVWDRRRPPGRDFDRDPRVPAMATFPSTWTSPSS